MDNNGGVGGGWKWEGGGEVLGLGGLNSNKIRGGKKKEEDW